MAPPFPDDLPYPGLDRGRARVVRPGSNFAGRLSSWVPGLVHGSSASAARSPEFGPCGRLPCGRRSTADANNPTDASYRPSLVMRKRPRGIARKSREVPTSQPRFTPRKHALLSVDRRFRFGEVGGKHAVARAKPKPARTRRGRRSVVDAGPHHGKPRRVRLVDRNRLRSRGPNGSSCTGTA